jgi:small subunit ribosomal protein S14
MARKAHRLKQLRSPKFKTRVYNRCQLCGRARAYYRKFKVCRICIRSLAHRGEVPGMVKASW